MKSCPKECKKNKGFTLIELLVVIGILAILLSIVLIAVNPARQFGMANDTKRKSDIAQILSAIGQYSAENQGVLPVGIPLTTAAEISNAGADICADLIPNYIPALPSDPQTGGGTEITDCTTYSTGYSVVKNGDGRVTVSAVGEIEPIIEITR
ncbi:MAG: type II secretion system protein [Candidatus Levyibacteriota bacterium]